MIKVFNLFSRFYTLSILLAAVVLFVCLETAIYFKRRQIDTDFKQEVLADGEAFSNNFIEKISKDFDSSTDGIIAYVKAHKGEIDSIAFSRFLQQLRVSSESIDVLNLVVDSTIKYVEPLAGNEEALNLYLPSQKDVWDFTISGLKEGKGVVIGPTQLVQGGVGILYKKPIFIDGVYWGLAASVFNLDTLLNHFVRPFAVRDHEMSILMMSNFPTNEKASLIWGDSSIFSNRQAVLRRKAIHNATLDFAFLPKAEASDVTWLRYVEIYGVLGILLTTILVLFNVNRRRWSIERLKVNELKLRTIYDNTFVGVSIFNDEGQRTFSNRRACEILGYALSDLLGAHFSKVVHPEDAPKAAHIFSQLLSGQTAHYDGELRVINKLSQQVIWIHVNFSMFPAAFRAKDEAIIVTYQDITAQKAIEERLKDLNASKNRLFSIVAHDLKSPLNAIKGLLQLANQESISHEEFRMVLSKLQDRVDNAGVLLGDLLDWAQNDSGLIAPMLSEINLQDIANQVIQTQSGVAEAKRISLVNKIDARIVAWADPYMVNTIMRNLIANAIKYSFELDRITLDAHLTSEGFVEVAVHDTGIGLTAEEATNIFDFAGKSSKDGTKGEKGTGLGLSLCKELVEKQGGKLSVESSLAAGTTFSFSLSTQLVGSSLSTPLTLPENRGAH